MSVANQTQRRIGYVRSVFASSCSELKIFRVSLPRLNFGRLPPTILFCARAADNH